MEQDIEISRRAVLAGAVGGVAVFSAAAQGSSAVAVPTGRGRTRFLTRAELRTLAAAVDRVVPGADEDNVPGAVAARCHHAIDALLGAFTVSPPRIYAGGPFSDRGGARRNDFAEFLPLDRYETKAWRVRIEGSRGRKRLERNGKVTGYQRTYRRGLAALEAAVPGGFSEAPAPVRDLAMRDDSDPAVKAMVDLAVTHTLEFMYGAPEYGGNRDLLGWTTTDFDGDVQPRGWTREQVENPESSPPLDLVDDLLGGALGGASPGLATPLVAMGSTETLHGVRAVAGDRFSVLQDMVTSLAVPTGEAAAQLAQLQSRAQQLVDRGRRSALMGHEAVVIGSGAAGSVVAWELARQGWDVTVLERGRNLRPGLGQRPSDELGTKYGSDEIKGFRQFGFPDPVLEPYTTRTRSEADQGVARSAVGALGQLGAAVGGTSLHYNAKTPRFWKQDFTMLSDHGPVDGAQVADWPIGYDDLEPYYDIVERRVGVQGDRRQMPARTLEQSPRRGQFVMPPNPTGYAAQLLAQGAQRMGYQAYPYPAAVNSETYAGRPACNSCGMCSGFGCPINARGDALVSWLNPAMRTGRVRVISRAFVHRIETNANGRRARAVHWTDVTGRKHRQRASTVVVAGSPINTARLLLLSRSDAHPDGLGNGSGQLGRNMMFHNFTQAAALYREDIKPLRAQSTTLQVDDLVGPFIGPEVTALGVPYIAGGIVQVGSAVPPAGESLLVAGMLGYGQPLKQAMKAGILHARAAASQLIHQDLPQADNRVDLDPKVKDFLGLPAARITYSPHQHERAAAMYLGARLQAMHQLAPGAVAAASLPYPILNDGITYTAHLAGTARMGRDPRTSVCASSGRLHEVDNVYVADASTFPTFPGFNPTLTIMANALRIARDLATGRAS